MGPGKRIANYSHVVKWFLWLFQIADMLSELSRREKEANIKPDPDIDVYMKVSSYYIYTVN